jgi:hypothetical protein
VVADGAAADRLIARLAREDPRVGGAASGIARFLLGEGDGADERSVELGGEADVGGIVRALGIRAQADVVAGLAEGVRVDRRTGARTFLLRFDARLAAALGAPLGLQAGGGRADRLLVEVAFDAQGRAQALTVAGSAAVHGRAARAT